IKTSGGSGELSKPGINPGSYTVNESSLGGFSFTSLECTTTGGATVTKSSAEAKITIPIKGGATVTCTYTNTKQEPKLSITKQASPTTYSKVGELISYTIVATNTGNVTLSNVSVEDKPTLEGFSCSPSIPATLAPGASITCTGKHTVTQADLEAGKLSDTACVSATGASEQCASVELIGPP